MAKNEGMNLYQKLAKIRTPIEVLKKNAKGYGYTYVTEEEILANISSLMKKYEVSLIPSVVPGTMEVTPYSYQKTKADRSGKTYEEQNNEVIVKADMTWTWVNNADPTETIVVPWTLVGQQPDASQSFGTALTYASRYFLLKYFNVATSDDDPDSVRAKMRQAEEAEDRLVAMAINENIKQVTDMIVANNPDDREKAIKIVKKYAKDENGKATANFYVIEDPNVASALLKDLVETFKIEGFDFGGEE